MVKLENERSITRVSHLCYGGRVYFIHSIKDVERPNDHIKGEGCSQAQKPKREE